MSADESSQHREGLDSLSSAHPGEQKMRNLRPNTTSWTIPSTFVPVYELHFASENRQREQDEAQKHSQSADSSAKGTRTDRNPETTPVIRTDTLEDDYSYTSDLHFPPGTEITAGKRTAAALNQDSSHTGREGWSKTGGHGAERSSLQQSRTALSIFQDPQQVAHSESISAVSIAPLNKDSISREKALHSNVGVIDKAAIVMASLEAGPATLVELTNRSGLSRPTAHRIATALEIHHFVNRDSEGRFVLGTRFAELAVAAGNDHLLAAGMPILQSLHDRTGESAQIYRRQGDQRVCIASVEKTTGLRDSVPVGTCLSLTAGAASHILLAWEPSDTWRDLMVTAHFSSKTLSDVRRRDWAESVNEREIGVSSVSAPIRSASGQVIAAINLSGPSERMGVHPGHLYAPIVLSAAKHLSDAISHTGL